MGEIMNAVSLVFLDVWTFVFSQVGIFALGTIFGNRLKSKADAAIDGISAGSEKK